MMLTKLHLKNFKGFRDTEIPELRKVNLILGGQNVGKTSLLEAVIYAMGATGSVSLGSFSSLAKTFRPCEGNDSTRFWTQILGTPSKPNALKISITIDEIDFFKAGFSSAPYEFGGSNSHFMVDGLGMLLLHHSADVVIGEEKSPYPFSTNSKSAAEQVTQYGQLVTRKKKRVVLELLKKIEPRIDTFEALAPDGEHRVYADLNDGQILPLSQLGHGFTRLFELYSGLVLTDSKLALIDEIENGIHYSALPTVFQGIRELAESNGVQSIITTHSLEAIKAACEVFNDKPEDFQLIRLERTNDDNIRAVAINDEDLKIVMASGWEMR